MDSPKTPAKARPWVATAFASMTLSACASAGSSLKAAEPPVIRTRIETRLVCPPELSQPIPAPVATPAGAIIRANPEGDAYLDAKDAVTGNRLQTNGQQSVPPHTLKLAFRYDHPGLGCHARVIGNYVSWNAAPGETARDGGIIWDLHLNWIVFPEDDLSPELFFSGHNLFSGVQATDTILSTNAPRWFDGGVRFKF